MNSKNHFPSHRKIPCKLVAILSSTGELAFIISKSLNLKRKYKSVVSIEGPFHCLPSKEILLLSGFSKRMYQRFYLVGEDQLAKRRQKVSKQDRVKLRKIEDGNPMTACPEVSTSNYHSDESSSYNQSPPTDLSPFKSELDDDDYPRPLSEEYRKEIQNLEEQYAVVFDQPYNEAQFKKLTESPRSANDLFNLTDIFIRRLIKFAKHVPEFKQLQQEDQIHLLKVGCSDTFLLQGS